MAVEINEKNELPEHVAGDVVQSNCTKVYNTTGRWSNNHDIIYRNSTTAILYHSMALKAITTRYNLGKIPVEVDSNRYNSAR